MRPTADPQALAAAVESAIAASSSLLGRAAHARAVRFLFPPLTSFLSNHLINMYSKLDTPRRPPPSSPSIPSPLLSRGRPPSREPSRTAASPLPRATSPPCYGPASAPTTSPSPASSRPPLLSSPLLAGERSMLSHSRLGSREMFTLGVVLWTCTIRPGVEKMPGRCLTSCLTRVVSWNPVMTNAVADGRPDEVIKAFVQLRISGLQPNSITICAFLNACASVMYLDLGTQFHGVLIKSGYNSGVFVGNGLVDFYGKCHQVEPAKRVFDGMLIRNDVSWCSMVVACAQNGEEESAFQVYLNARRQGWIPTDFMVSSILTTCSRLAGLDLGKSVHAIAVRSCIDANVFVGSALVDMYRKCGSIVDAEKAFEEVPVRNLITWNSMIGGYTQQGQADMAFTTFDEMICEGEVNPNYVTLLNVMTACSRGGLVQKGLEVFYTMKARYGIEPHPENYACVVDLLGRAGMEKRAYEFILKMPMRPSVSVWGALLGACKMHGKMKLGSIAAEKLFELDAQDSGNHVLLSNMLASTGRWEEAMEVRTEMKNVGIKKGPGCSWITWKNVVHVFQAKDTTHERNEDIKATLDWLKREMKASGYEPDTKFTLFDLEEEEKETELFHHSEKLALAFALLCIPVGIPIRITINLKVCGDCHSAIKFISGIVNRELIVRDNNRFHQFKDRKCSCRDFW